MKIDRSQVADLVKRIETIVDHIHQRELAERLRIDNVDPYYRDSAINMVHYDAFREKDLREIQKILRNLALSRLANAGSHLESSLLNTILILKRLLGEQPGLESPNRLPIQVGKLMLRSRTIDLLGEIKDKRRVRIMVTLPSEAATNYEMVQNMVSSGMDCARINCAHDNEETWLKIIKNVNAAAAMVGRNVKIAMDLAGPKIRTGPIEPGPRIRKFTPKRDESGHILKPALIQLVKELSGTSNQKELVVDAAWLRKLQKGDKLKLVDTRDKKRRLHVIETGERVLVETYKTCYISTGTRIIPKNINLPSTLVGTLPAMEQAILLNVGDEIYITREQLPGIPARLDTEGKVIEPARVSCLTPELIDQVGIGETVLFDDGKIEGKIIECTSDYFIVRITRSLDNGTKLRAEKGMNFPQSQLNINGLSQKDREDLKFVAKHADIVNFSFVNNAEDVRELFAELKSLNALEDISVILKIETKMAYQNLKDILFEAMRSRYIGVMIARGDLAVEIGWDRIGQVQNEILSLCEAAHIPVVWATQVLENLAKKGLPSRSEITDATSSLRAECVMLNKGAYILDAIRLLNTILIDMERFHEKNEHMLPKLAKL
ncbi:hypothetical protein J1N09_14130 [Aureitalea sp. L0-47]|uniref:pyruvate kinase n=1 Tax=Aureitalea sp. L0-47 TaxID=2816962 RepID=UPI0022378290|nr:pyruvate kinase [Aureitalea sp. L0-47]MCW5520983.1 hypothetical protein [Aureitalea sp. L0-47]